MTPTKLLIGRVVIGLAIVLLSVWAAVQSAAAVRGHWPQRFASRLLAARALAITFMPMRRRRPHDGTGAVRSFDARRAMVPGRAAQGPRAHSRLCSAPAPSLKALVAASPPMPSV